MSGVPEEHIEAAAEGFCQRCWDKAVDAAVRSGFSPTDLYRAVCRQPRSHCHGIPAVLVEGEQP